MTLNQVYELSLLHPGLVFRMKFGSLHYSRIAKSGSDRGRRCFVCINERNTKCHYAVTQEAVIVSIPEN